MSEPIGMPATSDSQANQLGEIVLHLQAVETMFETQTHFLLAEGGKLDIIVLLMAR